MECKASPSLRYRPSSSAFQWGDLVLTQYNSGCLRSIVLTQLLDYRVDIDPIYQLLGAHHEDLLAERLKDKIADRELVIKAPITDNVIYSGRADFILKDGTILEAKASVAKGKYKRERLPKQSHISQVVSYMGQLERPYAEISWGHYKAIKKMDLHGWRFELVGEAKYAVGLADNGQVVVDGERTPYFVQDQLAHMHAAANGLESGDWKALPRPYNWKAKFGSPCSWCPFKEKCYEV